MLCALSSVLVVVCRGVVWPIDECIDKLILAVFCGCGMVLVPSITRFAFAVALLVAPIVVIVVHCSGSTHFAHEPLSALY